MNLDPKIPETAAVREQGSPEWMLEQLSTTGLIEADDYNEEVDGYFGWKVTRNGRWATLEITHENGDGASATHQWRLVPVKEGD